jgi:hypothetical protein
MVGEASAKAHNAGETVNDTKAGARRLGDQQAAIVGAKIEGRIGGTVGGPAIRYGRLEARRSCGTRGAAACVCVTDAGVGAGLISELPSMRSPAIAG